MSASIVYATKTATTPTGKTTVYSVYADQALIGTVVGGGANWRIASDFYTSFREPSIVGRPFSLSQTAIEQLVSHHSQTLAERADRKLMATF